MTRRFLATLLVAGFATTVAAQPVPLDSFLEQRVAEELAADGTILSRLGVALDVEIVGDKLIVSLVDPATRRALATTKIDTLPEDREAAVATVTQIVANLTTQLPSNNATATAVKSALEEDRKKREEKELAKAAFEREEIRFNDVAMVSGTKEGTRTTLEMIPYRGGRRLSMPEFYDAVDRSDLSASYYLRRNLGIGAIVVGGAAVLGGMYLSVTKGLGDCFSTDSDYEACSEEADKWETVGLGLAIGGVVVATAGYLAVRFAKPIGDREAYDLADAHNAKLRAKHGLPTAQRAKRFHEVAFAPYTGSGGAGLSVLGRF